MAFEIDIHLEIIEIMENYISKIRPAEHLRLQLDISYKIEGQSVLIFEVRPSWLNAKEKIECHVAKATFVKAANSWKVFCIRSDLKWHIYKPQSVVSRLNDFIKLVEEDKYNCFWG